MAADVSAIEQLAQLLPLESAAQAVKDFKAEGRKAEAKALERALKKRMDDVAKAQADAEAKAEADRKKSLADNIEKYEAATKKFEEMRDSALEHLAKYIAEAEAAIAESGNYASIFHLLHSLHDPEKDEPLPELPQSAHQVVNSDPRFKGKFHGSNNIGRTVNL